MSKEDYQKLLDQHDWYWQMSDSPHVRDRGYKEEEYLKSFHNNEELKKLYFNQLKIKFNGKS